MAPGVANASTHVVELFLSLIDAAGRIAEPIVSLDEAQASGGAVQRSGKGATCSAGEFVKSFQHFDQYGHGQFCCGRRRGGTDIGHEIGDGEIDFVADGADDGDGAGEDCTGDHFFVECPEVFDRSAAAADDEQVDAPECGLGQVYSADGVGDFRRRAVALDASAYDTYLHRGITPADGAKYVA